MLCNNWLKIAIIDEIEHILWGIFVNLPFIFMNLYLLIVAIIFSFLIDIDHMLWAGSLSVKKMLNLGGRPAFHSLPIIAIFTAIVYLVTRSPEITIVSAYSMFSHLIWDLATGGVRLFYPLAKKFAISKRVSFVLFLVLFLSALIITHT